MTYPISSLRIILQLACVLLLGVGLSFAQCTSYTPDPSSFPYTFSQPQMINQTVTAPDGTVTPQSFTQPGTNFVGNPFDYASVLGSNQSDAFTICSGTPMFSGSGSSTAPATAASNYFTNTINLTAANGVLTILNTGTRTQPPTTGTFSNTIVYTVQTGAFHITSQSQGAFTLSDPNGDVITGTLTTAADIQGTWPIILPLMITTKSIRPAIVGNEYNFCFAASPLKPSSGLYPWEV